jgi:hypothetical protein
LWRREWTIQNFVGWTPGERKIWSLGNVCKEWESKQVSHREARSKGIREKGITWGKGIRGEGITLKLCKFREWEGPIIFLRKIV